MRRSPALLTAVLGVLLTLVLAGAVSGCGGEAADAGDGAASSHGTRTAAPSFSGVTMSGTGISSEGFKGKPLVLVFWASW